LNGRRSRSDVISIWGDFCSAGPDVLYGRRGLDEGADPVITKIGPLGKNLESRRLDSEVRLVFESAGGVY
jgi:hypothetical protein